MPTRPRDAGDGPDDECGPGRRGYAARAGAALALVRLETIDARREEAALRARLEHGRAALERVRAKAAEVRGGRSVIVGGDKVDHQGGHSLDDDDPFFGPITARVRDGASRGAQNGGPRDAEIGELELKILCLSLSESNRASERRLSELEAEAQRLEADLSDRTQTLAALPPSVRADIEDVRCTIARLEEERSQLEREREERHTRAMRWRREAEGRLKAARAEAEVQGIALARWREDVADLEQALAIAKIRGERTAVIGPLDRQVLDQTWETLWRTMVLRVPPGHLGSEGKHAFPP